MSRIAKKPIVCPDNVDVKISGRVISVKGPKGELSMDLLPGVGLQEEKNTIKVVAVDIGKKPDKNQVARLGTTRVLVNNLILGVNQGFEKSLSISGVGYRAKSQGDKLNMSMGFSHPVVYPIPAGIKIDTPSQTEITVYGACKQQVGQVAAEIRAIRPPDPYKIKGIRYLGERIKIKQGKKK